MSATVDEIKQEATQVVGEMVSEWTALRHAITDLAGGHPRHICWICSVRPRKHGTPGIPVGWCGPCNTEMENEQ